MKKLISHFMLAATFAITSNQNIASPMLLTPNELSPEASDSHKTAKISLVQGDYLPNYDYQTGFSINKNNGSTLKFYIESYSSDYIKYKIKCNGMIVSEGLVNGNDSKDLHIKAQDADFEVILNNSENGNRMNGYITIVQNPLIH
ncbi:MAG: hypothetical protein ACRCTE_01630 [Cellulosilyticaceae bacterium]